MKPYAETLKAAKERMRQDFHEESGRKKIMLYAEVIRTRMGIPFQKHITGD